MRWFELFTFAIYIQAFIWYGRLSYVQGVLDRHLAPELPKVRKVIEGNGQPVPARVLAGFSARVGSRRAR